MVGAVRFLMELSSTPVSVLAIVADTASRSAAAYRRARHARVVLATAAVGAFVAAGLLARATTAGHAKRPLAPLAAPRSFQAVVHANALQGGLVAPANAPPSASTSQS
jgi:tRNA C32,U32 (ribose-2'-O)-methylase TrmJ